MITRHHIILAMMCSLIMGMALIPSDVLALGALITGCCIGAVLPDIHMTRPKRVCLRTVAWGITRFSACICVPVFCVSCYAIRGLNLCPSDKRLTHSVPGIILTGAMVIGFSAVPVLLFSLSPVPAPLLAFVGGVLAGLVLHLVEDACTRKGIVPLFPFSRFTISGSIRPCDRTDSRMAQYHFHHCSMAAAILILHLGSVLPQIASVLLSLSALCACLGMMVWFSDVRIENARSLVPGNFRPPASPLSV